MNWQDFWKLGDSFTVVHAALLIIGLDPAEYHYVNGSSPPNDRPDGFDAVFAALTNAINTGTLRATIRRDAWEHGERVYNVDPEDAETTGIDQRGRSIIYKSFPDWNLSTVTREDLTGWLSLRNFKPTFFFEQAANAPDYLDSNHKNYSPKLAAAIRAWEAVTTDQRYHDNGKTPKTNIENWLSSHAAEYNLVKDDGELNADAIKNQIAKVANWQTDGGAPKTPNR